MVPGPWDLGPRTPPNLKVGPFDSFKVKKWNPQNISQLFYLLYIYKQNKKQKTNKQINNNETDKNKNSI